MNSRSLLLGLLIGGTAAGIATILTSPTSGKETRQYLKTNASCIRKQMKELNIQLIALKNSVISASKESKNSFSTFSAEIKPVINRWKHEILPHQETLQKEIHEIEEALTDLEKRLSH